MGDQAQVVNLQSQVFAPPLSSGHGLPVQRAERRIEGLQHRQRRDIDTANRQTGRVPAQMVDQRFDLGQFGHIFSLPIATVRCPSRVDPLRAEALSKPE